MALLWFSLAVALLALGLAVVVTLRSPRHPAHLSLGVGLALLGFEAAIGTLAALQGAEADPSQNGWYRLRFVVAALLPAPWILFSRCYSRGDSVRALERSRIGFVALAVVPVLFALAFREGIVVAPDVLTLPPTPLRLGWVGFSIEILLLLASVAILTNLERTFRESVGVMRWRIKYMILGVGALFAFRLYETSQALLYRTPENVIGEAGAAALLVGCGLIAVSLARGRVFDVDVYPSQTLVYRSLTVLLAGAYLLIVGLLSHALTLVGGAGAFPLKAFLLLLALAGLTALLLSERLRQRIRRFVSRHLRRPGYDYRQVWNTFTARTTSLVSEDTFCRAVASWSSETFQALSASVWLVQESADRLRLGASTALGESAAEPLEQPSDALRAALAALAAEREPILLDAEQHPWDAAFERLQPGVFSGGGSRVCQPLHASGRLLGLLTLGDRVGGHPFNTEELDLLKCVGDQVAASLLGLQLSSQLLRAKEMEAFQTMSAFFVHDLKNTASTLSLTLQNLHQHFSDPAFRDDALRAVGKSVQHLNDLIARLSRLRQELRVQPVPGDLRGVLETALTSIGPAPNVRIHRDFETIPPVLMDAEQVQKVLVNILLNAREAVGQAGEIRLTIRKEGGCAILSVSDNGCGMSPEFVRRSLFRPFQTTKKNGLGIGMFQSKMIVEAHQGRMEVETAPGQGTTVRVHLPLVSST